MAYARIEDGRLVYATIKNGALITNNLMIWCLESEYPNYGYYPIRNVMEDPEEDLPSVVLDEEHNVILNYIGAPYNPEISTYSADEVPNLPTAYEVRMMEIQDTLGSNDKLMEALERLIAVNGATPEDRAMAQERVTMRDELGKVVNAAPGEMENPYLWQVGAPVITGKWYKTPSGYFWEAKADGVPEDELDSNYFDTVV